MSGLGQVIQAYRQARGLSSRALAAAAGIAPQTLWLIEHGATQRPRPQNLVAIGRVLGIAPARLQALANGLPAGGHVGVATRQQGTDISRHPGADRRGERQDTQWKGDTMKWVTRAGVRMDRSAMAWLIRTKIDPEAEITILPESEVMEYAEETGATPFHHPKAELRHTGTRTGFDALRVHFDLQDPALGLMALIIRGAETNDRSLTQWSAGFQAIGSGLRNLTGDDETFIANMALVLDGLYRFCQDQLAPVARPTAERRSE
jgi:DNA-binding XRE family transcriptional regulator